MFISDYSFCLTLDTQNTGFRVAVMRETDQLD